MQDIYILPDRYDLSCWITHAVGVGGLMLLLSGNSNLTRGVVVTGSAPAENGCLFDNYYFRYFFSNPSVEEQRKRLDSLHPKENGHENCSQEIKIATVDADITIIGYDKSLDTKF